jgi:hypothetical protein
MKQLIAVAVCLATGLANADCYVRSSTTIAKSSLQSAPTDFRKIAVPDAKGNKCIIQYRVYLDNKWATVEGEGTDRDEAVACAKALDSKRAAVLEEPTREMLKSDQQLVCTDLPEIRVRPVRVGEVIWESETDQHPFPKERGYFNLDNAQCRRFSERNTVRGDLKTYQGIICRADLTSNSKWRVIDKY